MEGSRTPRHDLARVLLYFALGHPETDVSIQTDAQTTATVHVTSEVNFFLMSSLFSLLKKIQSKRHHNQWRKRILSTISVQACVTFPSSSRVIREHLRVADPIACTVTVLWVGAEATPQGYTSHSSTASLLRFFLAFFGFCWLS